MDTDCTFRQFIRTILVPIRTCDPVGAIQAAGITLSLFTKI